MQQNPSSSGNAGPSGMQGMPQGLPMLQQGLMPAQLQFAQAPFMQQSAEPQGVDPAQLHQLAQTYQLHHNTQARALAAA